MMECKFCESKEVTKFGVIMMRRSGRNQRFKCKECGGIFAVPFGELADNTRFGGKIDDDDTWEYADNDTFADYLDKHWG